MQAMITDPVNDLVEARWIGMMYSLRLVHQV